MPPEPSCCWPASWSLAPAPPASGAASAAWSTLEFAASGAAGEWLLLYHPLPEPVTALQYPIDVTVTARGDGGAPVGLITGRAEPTIDGGNGTTAEIEDVFDRPALSGADRATPRHPGTF